MVSSTAFDTISQEQSKKVSLNKPVDSTYIINTSDGNQYILMIVLQQNKFINDLCLHCCFFFFFR